MRFRLAFWMRDYPHARPGDVVDVPDQLVPALVKAGIGHEEPPEPLPERPTAPDTDEPADELQNAAE